MSLEYWKRTSHRLQGRIDILEREFRFLKVDNSDLRAKYDDILQKNYRLQARIVELEAKLRTYEPPPPPESPELNEKEIDLIKSGHYIDAIKKHRGRTGMGLKESKDVVDRWRDAHPEFR